MPQINQVPFTILGFSITIASFLPVLIYTYNKSLLTSLDGEKNPEKFKNVISFIYTNDLLLTQIMIQVVFSSFYGLIIFTDFNISFSNDQKAICLSIPVLVGLALHWTWAFCWSKTKINDQMKYMKEKELIDFWPNSKCTKTIWLRCTWINLIMTTCFVVAIYVLSIIYVIPWRSHIMVLFICIQSMILILLAISWIFPLVLYHPLMTEMEETIQKFILDTGIRDKSK